MKLSCGETGARTIGGDVSVDGQANEMLSGPLVSIATTVCAMRIGIPELIPH